MKPKYEIKIYSGTLEDSTFEFETITKGFPKTIQWIKAPGYATIERVKK